MQRDKIRYNARFAGSVRRYHTWPVLNQQTVADHTWHVMRICYQLWGPLPPEVSTYIIWHDALEIVTGDLPFPIKRDTPELAELLSVIDDETRVATGWPYVELSPLWKKRVKICDLIEMHEYGMVEYRQGNKFALPIVNDTRTAVWQLAIELCTEDQKAIDRFIEETATVTELLRCA